MPCRTRRRGLEVEGLGIVYLEAAAAGLPVVVGDSGGAPDAVRDGETGYVVDGRSVAAVADRLVRLLGDARLAEGMGRRGRAWVREEWDWDRSYAALRQWLDLPAVPVARRGSVAPPARPGSAASGSGNGPGSAASGDGPAR